MGQQADNAADRSVTDFLELWDRHLARTETPRIFRLWSGIICLSSALQRKCSINDGVMTITPQVHVLMISSPRVDGRSTVLSVVRKVLSDAGITVAPDGVIGTRILEWWYKHQWKRKKRRLTPLMSVTAVTTDFRMLKQPVFQEAVSDFWDGVSEWGKYFKKEEEPFFSVIAGATTLWISENIKRKAFSDRFFARTIMLKADRAEGKRATAATSPNDWMAARMEQREIVSHLKTIMRWKSAFRFGKGSIDWLDEWNTEHLRKEIDPCDEYGAAMHGIMRLHLLKLAMICAASRGCSATIKPKDLDRAVAIFAESESAMKAAARLITGPARKNLPATIVKMLEEAGGKMPSAEIAKHLLRCGHEMEEIDKAMSSLTSGTVRVIRIEIDVEAKEEVVHLL